MPKTLTDFFNEVDRVFDKSAGYTTAMLADFDAGGVSAKVRVAVMTREHCAAISAILAGAKDVPGLIDEARRQYRAVNFDPKAQAELIIPAANAVVAWVDANLGSNLTASKATEFRGLLVAFRDAASPTID